MFPPSADFTEENISRLLQAALDNSVESPYPPGFFNTPTRPAAVLMPLLLNNSTWHLLFIHRTHHKDDPHSGQVAFPGGARDSSDQDSVGNALREAHEELGILPTDVQVLGQLNDMITITGYQVTPVIGKIPWPYELKLASHEVSRCFTIPLDWLADTANYVIEERKLPEPYTSIPVILYKIYDGEVLWGASAKFSQNLINALFTKPVK